jgi:hypothetical protein
MYPLSIDFDVPLAAYTPTFEALEDRVATAIASLIDLNALPTPTKSRTPSASCPKTSSQAINLPPMQTFQAPV